MGIYASKVKPLSRTERCQQSKARNEARKVEQIARDKAIVEARAKRGDIGQLYQLDKKQQNIQMTHIVMIKLLQFVIWLLIMEEYILKLMGSNTEW